MNVICLTGNICKELKLEYTKNNKCYVQNTIAVKKDKKNEDGTYQSDFIDFVAFEKKGEYLNQYASKGDKIEINGKLRVDTWKDENEQYHTRSYIVCDKVNILSSKAKEENPYKDMSIKTETQQQFEITDEDLPF